MTVLYVALGIIAAVVGIGWWATGKTLPDLFRRKKHAPAADPTVQPHVPPPTTAPPDHIWHVPLPRNLNFTGRDDMLTALREKLTSGCATALTQTAAVHGLGGIGKTQLALEYSYRHRNDYKYVWWIRAEQPASLAGDFGELGAAVGVDPRQEPDAIRDQTKAWLDANDGWLLVFDNAQNPEDLSPYLPQCGTGHVIITSRHSDWAGRAEELPTDVLPKDKAVEFLLKRTGKQDEQGAEKLAEELGHLPLALEQAGGYIKASGQTFGSYLEMYRTQHSELLDRGKPKDYPDTVATTWQMSFESAAKQAETAAELLGICAFLGADDIPASMFAMLAGETLYTDAVAALQEFSLLTAKDESLSVHRLVQEVVRDRMDKKTQKQLAEAALNLVNAAFPQKSHDVRFWPECIRLLPHALSVLKHSEELGIATRAAGRLPCQVGLYFKARAAYTDAERWLTLALKVYEKVEGKKGVNVATALNNLAGLLQSMGKLAEAELMYRKALAIRQKALGEEHPDSAQSLNNLALLLRDMGRLAEAEPMCRKAIAIGQKALGEEHPDVATGLNNLALLLRDMGRLAEAEPMYRKALGIRQKALPPEHPDIARSLNNLASLLQDVGKLAEAEPMLRKALAIRQKALGEDHPDAAFTLNNLAGLLYAMHRNSEAEPLARRSLEILLKHTKATGHEHPNLRGAFGNYAGLLRAMGRSEKEIGETISNLAAQYGVKLGER